MRIPRTCTLALTLVTGAAGCAPKIMSARLTGLPAQPDGNVALYSTKRPECPYDEIGLITGNRRHAWTSLDDVLAAMRTRALTMGGDAIVGLATGEEVSGSGAEGVVNIDTSISLKGTVVRFTDRRCRK